MASTTNTKFIAASPERVYEAFTNPNALEQWLVPGDMTGRIHSFDLRENGGYEMSLYYPESDTVSSGKSGAKEDRYEATFIRLDPPHKIVMAITFSSDDAAFSGEMFEYITLESKDGGTQVTITFEDIPKGIKPSDNKEGTDSSLEKLAAYLL